MSLHLVTGHAGYEHITPADHGAFHNALLLSGSYVLNSGNKFSATVVTNNSIKISDGELIMQGRHIRLKPGEYEAVTIDNGTQGYKRNDLIVARYSKDGTSCVETVSFVVIKGTPGTTASDPAHIEGNILNGVLTADFPLYRVPLNGLNVGDLVPLFTVKDSFDKRISDIVSGAQKVGNADKLDGHDSDYFATAEGLKNAQTTSNATLSQSGWYRVAKITHTSANTGKGRYGNICNLVISRVTANSVAGETHLLQLISRESSQKFKSLSSSNGKYIVKARYVYSTTASYLEIYYSADSEFKVFVTINSSVLTDGLFWQAITPTLTQETVDGVTVTTTYDIPANDNPVTDLDLQRVDGTSDNLNTSILDKALEVDNGVHVFRLGGGDYPVDAVPHSAYRYGMATIYKRSSNIVVRLHGQGTNAKREAFNIYDGVSWSGWDEYATTADLAKYSESLSELNGTNNLSTAILETARTLPQGKHEFSLSSSLDTSDIPNAAYRYGWATVDVKQGGNIHVTLWGVSNSSTRIATQYFDGTSWRSNWVVYASKSDLTTELAKYLPLTGGNVDSLTVSNKTVHHDGNSAKIWTKESTPPDTSYVHIY